MKKKSTTIFLVLILVIGLSLLLYPSLSDYYNSFHQSRAIADYSEAVSELSDTDYEVFWNDAKAYNVQMESPVSDFYLDDEEKARYNELLNIAGNGIMGYIEIPSIDINLPIYHGTEEAVLQTAVGHIEGTSLPTGGESTHCVLSGHRGLPTARLFTDLDQLDTGDIFVLHILDEVLTYEVDQILIVEPHEIDALQIEEGKDLCTLVTCTPYGVNTHRLLVRGHRVENVEDTSEVRISADATRIEPIIVAPIVAIPIVLLLVVWVLVRYRNKRK